MIPNFPHLLIFSCFISLLSSLVLTPGFRKIAAKIGAIDEASQYRKIHVGKIPRFGGPPIFLSFFASLIFTVYFFHQESILFALARTKFQGLLLGALIILITGIIDDIKGVSPLFKVVGTLLAIIIAFYFGFQIKIINTPFGNIKFQAMSFPITAIWLLFTTNAINLIDGIDGLAVGVAIVASVTIFTLNVIAGNMINALLMASFFGTCLGFLVYNYHPASIFLGDSGSMLLGFLLGNTMLLGSYRHAMVGFAIPLIIFALPIADTSLAVLRRWARRMPISSADREHIHHRLLDFGLTQVQAVVVLWGLTTYFGIIAILISLCKNLHQTVIVGLSSLALLSFVLMFKWGNRIKLTDLKMVSKRIRHDVKRSKQRSHNWELINHICLEIKHVKSEYKLIAYLEKAFSGLDMDSCVIITTIPSISEPGKTFSFYWKRSSEVNLNYNEIWSAQLCIKSNNRSIGMLFVTKRIERSDLPDDITECLRELRTALAARLVPDQAILPWQLSPKVSTESTLIGKHKKRKILLVHSKPRSDLNSPYPNTTLEWHTLTSDKLCLQINKINLSDYDILLLAYSTLPDQLDSLFSYLFSKHPTLKIIVFDCPSHKFIENLFDKGIVGFPKSKAFTHTLFKFIESIG